MPRRRPQPTEYVQELGWVPSVRGHASMVVRIHPADRDVEDYAVVLTCTRLSAEPVTVQVCGYAHGDNERHRCDQSGNKLPGETFHDGSAQEGLDEAKRLTQTEFVNIMDAWAQRKS